MDQRYCSFISKRTTLGFVPVFRGIIHYRCYSESIVEFIGEKQFARSLIGSIYCPLTLVIIVFFLGRIQIFGQQLTVGAQVRPRAEFRNGFKTLTEDDRDAAFFVEQRTRLFTDYKTNKFRIRINIQDIRIWGSVDQIAKSDPNLFNLYEGWGEYYISDKLAVRMGRMQLDYNNARFLGNLDWAAQGRSHDALKIHYKNDSRGVSFHAGVAFNQTTDPREPARLFGTVYTGVSNYKHMQFAWFQKKFTNSDLSLLFQNDGRQVVVATDTLVASRQTYAVVGNHQRSGWSLGGEFYYQGGKNGSNNSVSAFLLALYITLKTDLTPVTVGIDHLSGTSITDTKDNSFDPLYGTNHKFYGFMDYFYVGNFHGQAATTSGLNDVFVKTSFKLSDKTSLNAHGHFFSSPASLHNPSDTSQEIDKYLGTELDLVLVWKPAKNVVVNLGYSQMWAASSMEAIKVTPGDHSALNNWAWLMVDFAPIIFQKDFGKR